MRLKSRWQGWIVAVGFFGLVGHGSSVFAGDTWDGGHGSPEEACRLRLDETGAFRFSRAQVQGNVAHCFTKAKDGEGGEFDDAAVTRDEPAPEAQAAGDSSGPSGGAAPSTPSASSAAQSGSACAGKKITDRKVGYFTHDFQQPLNDVFAKSPTEAGGLNAGWSLGRNVAVLELKTGDRIAFTSGKDPAKGKGLHSEQHLLNYMDAQKIGPDQVSRIYSELSPCLDRCLPKLLERFKGYENCVVIEYTWVHTDPESVRSQLQNQRRQQAMGK
ncbi:MAG: hypothetical protein BVN29_13765 [Nitrospira sp. ST-bin5]|nr:MAG: hypothetical protein BVN29_13765 [Nitrospira sp. ST-bin5]